MSAIFSPDPSRGYNFIFSLPNLFFLLALFLIIPSHAQNNEDGKETSNKDNSKLDVLFINLKQAANQTEARELEHQIWMQWFQSGDSNIDELMQTAMEKRHSYDFDGAIEVLNQVIELKPDYPEVWNQRATVYFHQKKYEESLIDIAKTLELEPRHFGSLAGRAMIRLHQLKPALARQNIVEALKLHPYLKEKDFFPDLEEPYFKDPLNKNNTSKKTSI